ncbi:MAG: DUF4340 domain-containing protein [Oscillospiraceae bacterium]
MSEEKQNPQELAENATAEADTIFGSTAQVTQTVQKGGLSKNSKGLIIGAVVLVALIAGAVGVSMMNQNTETDIDNSSLLDSLTDDEDKGIPLNEGTTNNVIKIQVKNTDEFTVVQTEKPKADGEKPLYAVQGYDDVNFDNDLLYTLANNGSGLNATELVEESPSDLGKYGLAKPLAEIALTYADGNVFQLKIGDPSPTNSGKSYCEWNGNVYLVMSSYLMNYQKTADAFISKTVLEKPDDNNYPIVEAVRIQRKDLDWDIYLEYDYEGANDDTAGGTAATHMMLEPVFSYLNVEKSVNVTNGIFGLTAEEIAVIHPEEQDFDKTGLSDPFCTVNVKCDNGEEYLLSIGDSYQTEAGKKCYYTALDGVNLIYGVSADNDIWATVQPGDITSANIFSTNVWTLSNLEVSAGGMTLNFEGEGTEQKNYVVTKNGSPCETERFRLLYRFLLSIYGEEFYIGELPEGEPDGEVHVLSQNGRDDYTISFYRVSDLKTIVARNGVASYVIRSSALDTLIYNLSIFDNAEEEFKTSWQ